MPTPLPPSLPSQVATLAALFANAGRHRPSDLLWSLDRQRMAPLLLATVTPPGCPPLWVWLRDATRRGEFWDGEDIALLSDWTGHDEGGWWLQPSEATPRPPAVTACFVESWLDEVVERKQQDDPRVHAMLATVPSSWFHAANASSRCAAAMNAERRAMEAHQSPPETPLSVALLDLGVDPFRSFTPPSLGKTAPPCFASLSHSRHLEWAERLYPKELADWLADADNFAALLRGMPEGDLRAGLLRHAAGTRGWISPDPLAAEIAMDRLLVDGRLHARLDSARPHFSATDPQGRTLFMLAMESAPRIQASSQRPVSIGNIVHGLGKALRARANRPACLGKDAAGRTLWPYLLAALPGHWPRCDISSGVFVNASIQFARTLEEKVGLPTADAGGHALLHQMLHTLAPDGALAFRDLERWQGLPVQADPLRILRLTRLFRTATQPQVWLGGGAELAGTLMERLRTGFAVEKDDECRGLGSDVSASHATSSPGHASPRRSQSSPSQPLTQAVSTNWPLLPRPPCGLLGTLRFLAVLARNLGPSAPSLDTGWQSLFLGAALLDAAFWMNTLKSSPGGLTLPGIQECGIEPWMQPAAEVPPWIRKRIRLLPIAPRLAEFEGVFSRQALLNQAAAVSDALSRTQGATPSRPRRRS